MTPGTRACVAYIAAGLNGSNSSSVFDYTESKYINISGAVNSSNVNIYDHDRGCHVTGSPSNLFDYGVSSHIQLNMNGTQFSGYDYHSGNHFSGNVNNKAVSIFDYETSSYYNYNA